MKNIAIFASGAGSNAREIIERLHKPGKVKVALILTNNPNAGVLRIAEENSIRSIILDKERFFRGDGYVGELNSQQIDLVVLAGFLWKIPATLIEAFPGGIVNIHPALLPKYGGKGMYGDNVHQAVIDADERESGITIHYVDEHYDNGDIIFQAKCEVKENDTPASLAARIHDLEHRHFSEVILSLTAKAEGR
jgi:phosphoribosylglycinamide formyltransferase 1